MTMRGEHERRTDKRYQSTYFAGLDRKRSKSVLLMEERFPKSNSDCGYLEPRKVHIDKVRESPILTA